MDYGKLNKEELILLCKERGLEFSSSWDREKLEDLLINSKLRSKSKSGVKREGLAKAGAIVNIVLSIISLVFGAWFFIEFIIMLMIGFFALIWLLISIALIIGAIFSIVSNVQYMNGADNKIMAGVLGLIFSGIIGGILVLISED